MEKWAPQGPSGRLLASVWKGLFTYYVIETVIELLHSVIAIKRDNLPNGSIPGGADGTDARPSKANIHEKTAQMHSSDGAGAVARCHQLGHAVVIEEGHRQ